MDCADLFAQQLYNKHTKKKLILQRKPATIKTRGNTFRAKLNCVRTYSQALELALQDSPFLFVIPTLLVEILVVALVPQWNRLGVHVHDSSLLVQILTVTGGM
jgi:hypothetical protein